MSITDILCLVASTFPKFLCTSLFLWSYWVLTFKIILKVIDNSISAIVLFVIVSISVLLCLVSYYMVVAIGPGSPLDFESLRCFGYREGDSMQVPKLLASTSVTTKQGGGYRFCNKCLVWKPDRCHHCSSCNRCILKMDHHCPWFSTCIGFKNHKFFMQFLIHTCIYLLIVAYLAGDVLYNIFYLETMGENEFSLHIVFVFLLAGIMELCLSVFTVFSLYQLLKNKTTIESYEHHNYRSNKKSYVVGNIFDLGCGKNWRVVMGNSFMEWLLPIRVRNSKSNGLHYDVNQAIYQQIQQESRLQQRLSSEIENYRFQQKQIQQQGVNGLLNGDRDPMFDV